MGAKNLQCRHRGRERENVGAGGKDVDDAAIVGEAGAGVLGDGGADDAGALLRGGGDVVGVLVLVAGGVVDGGRVAAAEAHAGKDALGARAAARVGDDKVHAGNDARVGAGPLVVEDLDAVDVGLLGDAVRGAADGAGAVGAVGRGRRCFGR